MWNHLPSDLLGRILSFLPPDSSACAASTCRDWHSCITCLPPVPSSIIPPPWFLAITTPKANSCFAYNSLLMRWYVLSLDFLPNLIHPIAPIENLILCRPANSSLLQLALCNPFTKQYKFLPPLNTPRSTPAVGVVKLHADHDPLPFNFRIFVAGGMCVSSRGCGGTNGGSSFEPTMEMYDSQVKRWQCLGLMPVDIAVRLTVWTPNESVYSMGVLYWITSARAYSIMGFNIGSGLWKEVNVPMADKLEFAALVRRGKGCLTLIGGKSGEEACIWELGTGDVWILIERVPVELGKRFTGCRGSWCNTKCVGTDEVVYLYKDLKSEMLVWMEVKQNGSSRWEWYWVQGCCSVRGQEVPKFSIKGMLLLPGIGPSI